MKYHVQFIEDLSECVNSANYHKKYCVRFERHVYVSTNFYESECVNLAHEYLETHEGHYILYM